MVGRRPKQASSITQSIRKGQQKDIKLKLARFVNNHLSMALYPHDHVSLRALARAATFHPVSKMKFPPKYHTINNPDFSFLSSLGSEDADMNVECVCV